MVPQPRHHVACAISVDRLVQAQRDVDQEVGHAGLGTLARVPQQEPEDALTGAVRRRHVLENRGEGGLRQEDGKGDVAGTLGPRAGGAPQDRLADRNRLTQRTGGGHARKIKRWGRLWRLVEVGGGCGGWEVGEVVTSAVQRGATRRRRAPGRRPARGPAPPDPAPTPGAWFAHGASRGGPR